MNQKEHATHHPADDPERQRTNLSGDEAEGDNPPDTKSGREVERG